MCHFFSGVLGAICSTSSSKEGRQLQLLETPQNPYKVLLDFVFLWVMVVLPGRRCLPYAPICTLLTTIALCGLLAACHDRMLSALPWHQMPSAACQGNTCVRPMLSHHGNRAAGLLLCQTLSFNACSRHPRHLHVAKC